MKARNIRRLWLSALLLASPPADPADVEDTGGWISGPFLPQEPWKEATVELPPWPDGEKLLPVRVDSAVFPFSVFIDPESLSVGSDHVVRYTLVVVSSSGARNVSFEGIRCNTREYRRYAYGSGDKWFETAETPWQKVSNAGMDGYRYILYRDYMCDPAGYDFKVNEILEAIRYSRGVNIDE